MIENKKVMCATCLKVFETDEYDWCEYVFHHISASSGTESRTFFCSDKCLVGFFGGGSSAAKKKLEAVKKVLINLYKATEALGVLKEGITVKDHIKATQTVLKQIFEAAEIDFLEIEKSGEL